MKSFISFRVILFFICLFVISSRLHAQDDMGKPKPIDNPTMAMFMGTWTSDPYEFFGSNWTDVATHSMKYNGQYMVIDLSSKDDKSHSYTGVIYISCDKDGAVSGWGFDEWGGVTTMTGKASGNHVSLTSKSAMGTEQREIEISGSTMVHTISSVMKGQDGKDMTMKMTVTYHKN